MDLLRTVTLSPGGRQVQRVNLADPTGLTVYTERSTFVITPAAKTQNWSRSSRKSAGQVQSGESEDNSTALASWWVKGGGNPNTVLANVELLLAEIDDSDGLSPNQPKYIEWRPDGTSFSTLLELRGAGVYVPHYEWAAFTGAAMMKLDLSWPVAPLALGLPLDISDPFDVDSRGDYTVDVGPALTYAAPAPGLSTGNVHVTGTPAEAAFRHTARGYAYGDVQVTAQFTVDGVAPTSVGVTCSAIDNSNYLLAKLSAGGLQIQKKDAGAFTTLATNATPVISINTNYFLRIRQEGNLLVADLYVGAIPPGSLDAPTYTVRVVLTGADITKFGIGAPGGTGIRMQAPPPTTLVGYFEALPYTYRNARLPETFDLRSVPGSASPAFDAQVTTSAPVVPVVNSIAAAGSGGVFAATGTYRYYVTANGNFGESARSVEQTVSVTATTQLVTITLTPAIQATGYNVYRTAAGGASNSELLVLSLMNVRPVISAAGTIVIVDNGAAAGTSQAPPSSSSVANPNWGLLSWTQKPRSWNRVWNGDFETNLDGWSAAANGQHAASTGIARSILQPDSGVGHALIVVPAVANAGAHFRVARRFKAGTTYTVTARLAAPVFTDAAVLQLGAVIPGTNGTLDSASVSQNLAATYGTWTVQWTPLWDYDFADVSVMHTAAGSGNIYVDAVAVYETSQGAPTSYTQNFGKGAMPPFGLLDVGACIPLDIVNGQLLSWSGAAAKFGISPSGTYFNALNAGNGLQGTAVIDWWVDPGAYATPDDFARGSVAIETFYVGDALSANPRVIVSAVPDPAQSLGQERFTQEHGNVGRPLVANVNGTQWSRTGTLVLPVNPNTPVRWKVKATLAWSGTGSFGGGFNLQGLVLAHAIRRACTPTGKSAADTTYPSWISSASTASITKTIRSGLRAAVAFGPTANVPDQIALNLTLQGDDVGLTGTPLELDSPAPTAAGLAGDHKLLVALSNLVPDDPDGVASTKNQDAAATVHIAVWPRYRLARFS